MSKSPQLTTMGKLVLRQTLTVTCRLHDQLSMGPKGVRDQSSVRISAPVSPPCAQARSSCGDRPVVNRPLYGAEQNGRQGSRGPPRPEEVPPRQADALDGEESTERDRACRARDGFASLRVEQREQRVSGHVGAQERCDR